MPKQPHPDSIQGLVKLISTWKISKVLLARYMEMSPYTLKMKLSGKYPAYRFTEAECKRLCEVMIRLCHAISEEIQ